MLTPEVLGSALPVGRFVLGLRRLLNEEPTLQHQMLRGEIARWSRARSGHVYLTLRDDDGSIDAVMWSSRAPRTDFQEGAEVVVIGSVDLYPARGQLQLQVTSIHAVDTIGELEAERRKLIAALKAEGVLDRPRRPLPALPRHVAIVIGSQSAAEADVLRLTENRWPGLRRTVIGVLVQGEKAAEELARGLRVAARLADPVHAAASGVPPVDVIIVGRGGGSTEDLWAFNLERVARAVVSMPVPVVSAVGHESDVLVSDLVADVRASTPSDAVERVVPVRSDLEQHHDDLALRLEAAAARRFAETRQHHRLLRHRLAGAPVSGLTRARDELADLRSRLNHTVDVLVSEATATLIGHRHALHRATEAHLGRERERLAGLGAALRTTDPRRVLERGYGMLQQPDGDVIGSVSEVAVGDALLVHLADGTVTTAVEDVHRT
ncbi:MAG: exodeoxyribonuclease VII large subunit [Candidatus Thermoplasmatota archaeon]|nr:exodeoxyribonuclease VII large subunit [Candidatus Thermoplasmatota archaeon]MEC8780411.1 exodeoxyribonuclease VII large subunit [Candidatus Thermoplasmatota archaeon]MEE2667182.1 exodeoxyribonuclease VII large subunit [Candidatus Thermoplasmatota archaeon]